MSVIRRRISRWYKSNRVFSLAKLLPWALIAEAGNFFRVLFLFSHPAFLKKCACLYQSRFEEVPFPTGLQKLMKEYCTVWSIIWMTIFSRVLWTWELERNNKQLIRVDNMQNTRKFRNICKLHADNIHKADLIWICIVNLNRLIHKWRP